VECDEVESEERRECRGLTTMVVVSERLRKREERWHLEMWEVRPVRSILFNFRMRPHVTSHAVSHTPTGTNSHHWQFELYGCWAFICVVASSGTPKLDLDK